MRKRSLSIAAAAAIVSISGLSACGAGEGANGNGDDSLLVWSLEQQPDRLAKAQAVAAEFSQETGIDVEIVGINEDQFPQLITTAAAAGDLPDIVGALPLAAVRVMSGNELVNGDAMQSVVDNLGADTFSPSALAYTEDDGVRVGIPSDGFPVSIIYRKDLFDAAGLPAPTTYDDLMTAVQTLDGPDIAGFVAGNDPGTFYTQQIFELFAQANGCRLVTDDGEVAIDSPECVHAFDVYGQLTRDYTVPGAMDSTGAKTVYMAGGAAVTVWASFILDEMAGLVDDAMPTCDECADDAQFIAKNSGIVTSLSGPDGGPASMGEVTSWVISSGAPADSAARFVEYFMSDGYLDWLSQAPEGKFPTRMGTADDPEAYLDGWRKLESGVDTKASLLDIYGEDAIDDLQSAVGSFDRWGFLEGQGALLGAVAAELPIAQAIGSIASDGADAESAAANAQTAIEAAQSTLQ